MKKTFKSVTSIILSLLLLLPFTGLFAVASEEQTVAQNTSITSPLTYHDTGVVLPSTDNLSQGRFGRQKTDSVTLPSSFDMRTQTNWLSPVRIQSPYGTCWSFASIAAAETNMVNKGLAQENVNLSELHLVYNTYKKVSDPLGNFTGDYCLPVGNTMLDNGGNASMATYSLARWGGVADESLMPYSDSLFAVGYDYPDDYSSGADVAHLENAYWMNITTDAASVKKFVMTNGAVASAYYEDSVSWNSNGTAYYQSDVKSSTNHAIAIVGWDDNYSKTNFKSGSQPENDGAWLIRNSWGENANSMGGYFWMSYDEASIKNTTAVAYDFASADNYDNNYQYDGSSWYSALGTEEASTVSLANVYTAQGNETLKAIGLFNPINTNISYELRIYKNPTTTNPATGTLMTTQSGSEVYCGYHTVKLNSPVALSPNDRFSVVVTMTNPEGTGIYFDCERTLNSWGSSYSAHEAGQSFYNFGSSLSYWTDLGSGSTYYSGNIRLKAFTDITGAETPTGLTASLSSGTVELQWDDIASADSYEIFAKGEDESDYSLLTTVTSNSYSYTAPTDVGLTLLYKIRAINPTTTSAFSKVAVVAIPTSKNLNSFDLDEADIVVDKGTTKGLTVNYYPETATDKLLAYSVEDSKIATVSSSGDITGVGYGNTTLSAVSRNILRNGGETWEAERTITVHVPEYIYVKTLEEMQSSHPLVDYSDQMYILKRAGATSVTVKFTNDTALRAYDYIKIYNSSNQLYATYSGNQLAGKTITLPGDTFKLHLAVGYYGTATKGFTVESFSFAGTELNTDALQTVLDLAATYSENEYTSASWEAFETAVSNGNSMMSNVSANQDDIDAAVDAINDAIEALVAYIPPTDVTITADGIKDGILRVIVPENQSITSASAQLSVSVAPDDAMYESIEWSSGDGFLNVSDSGLVTQSFDFSEYDTISATVTDKNGNTYTDSIVVAFMHVDTDKVVLNKNTLTLAPDESFQLVAAITDDEDNISDFRDVVWESSDESVATVENGVVTAVSDGKATITVKTVFGNYTDTCEVTVSFEHVHSYDSVVTPPTCTKQGYTTHTCLCGDSYVDSYVAATGHNFGDWSSNNDGTHSRTCLNDGCGEVETVNCSDFAVIDPAVAATCTKTGLTEGSHCSVCDYVISAQTEVAKAAHTPSQAVKENEVPATCTAKGSYDEVVYCSVCGEEISRTEKAVEKLNHTVVTDAAVAPTCTATGLTEGSHCSVCGEVIVAQTEVAKVAHTPSQAVKENEVSATCTTKGSYDEVVYCSVCGEEISRTEKAVEKLNHTVVTDAAVAPTCSKTGLTEGSHCSVCGEVIVAQTEVAKVAHTAVTDPAVAATCTKTGLTEGSHCSVCGETIVAQKVVSKLSHTYDEGLVTPPTCTKDGYTSHVCTVCGYSYTDSTVKALGHVDSDGDGKCDRCSTDLSANCSCMCHSDSSFMRFIYKIVLFFWKLFGTNKTCACGKTHY